MIEPINTNKAPEAIGPYSQAIVTDNYIYCSGQIGLDPMTGQVVEGLEAQTTQALTNLKSVLEAAGSDLNQVVKTTVFIKNIADFPKVNEIYAHFFEPHKPARSTVEVSNLPKGALIEIDCIAVIRN